MANGDNQSSSSVYVDLSTNVLDVQAFDIQTTTAQTSGYTLGTSVTYTMATTATFVYNGPDNQWLTDTGSFREPVFATEDERIAYQQEAWREPRDHEYLPAFLGVCAKCAQHNVHKQDASKHLYVIEEEIDWLSRLAS